jgi:hypothetical protein
VVQADASINAQVKNDGIQARLRIIGVFSRLLTLPGRSDNHTTIEWKAKNMAFVGIIDGNQVRAAANAF